MIGRPKFVLASGSPRRLALINQAGIEPDSLKPADIDETPKRGEIPRAYANRLAKSKAEVALDRWPLCIRAFTGRQRWGQGRRRTSGQKGYNFQLSWRRSESDLACSS